MEVYKVVADAEELKWFFEKMLNTKERKIQMNESYMICRSARNKKLSEEERKEFEIGRSEMMRTEILRKPREKDLSFEDFARVFYGYEHNVLGMTTKNNNPYPEKCLVTYIYLNPCSESKCIADTVAYASQIQRELIDAAVKGSQVGIIEQTNKLGSISSHIKSCHAQNPSRKLWVDFDIDCSCVDKYINYIHDIFIEKFGKGNFFMIRTSGGLHITVDKSKLNFNPNELCGEIFAHICSKGDGSKVSEVKLNQNCMIPTPGTWQGYHKVYIINKGDFE